jgi:hypothetical protein
LELALELLLVLALLVPLVLLSQLVLVEFVYRTIHVHPKLFLELQQVFLFQSVVLIPEFLKVQVVLLALGAV